MKELRNVRLNISKEKSEQKLLPEQFIKTQQESNVAAF